MPKECMHFNCWCHEARDVAKETDDEDYCNFDCRNCEEQEDEE